MGFLLMNGILRYSYTAPPRDRERTILEAYGVSLKRLCGSLQSRVDRLAGTPSRSDRKGRKQGREADDQEQADEVGDQQYEELDDSERMSLLVHPPQRLIQVYRDIE